MSEDDYFEGQNSKDCVIHSLNNAFGRRVVTKDEVLKHIEHKVADLVNTLEKKGTPEDIVKSKVLKLRERYSDGKTFFAADIVWDTAKKKGVFHSYVAIPGFSSPHVRMSSITPQVAAKPIVVLGGDGKGFTHAIACRSGMIYDSERVAEGPVPLEINELKKSLPKVFSAYVFLNHPSEVAIVRKGANAGMTVSI